MSATNPIELSLSSPHSTHSPRSTHSDIVLLDGLAPLPTVLPSWATDTPLKLESSPERETHVWSRPKWATVQDADDAQHAQHADDADTHDTRDTHGARDTIKAEQDAPEQDAPEQDATEQDATEQDTPAVKVEPAPELAPELERRELDIKPPPRLLAALVVQNPPPDADIVDVRDSSPQPSFVPSSILQPAASSEATLAPSPERELCRAASPSSSGQTVLPPPLAPPVPVVEPVPPVPLVPRVPPASPGPQAPPVPVVPLAPLVPPSDPHGDIVDLSVDPAHLVSGAPASQASASQVSVPQASSAPEPEPVPSFPDTPSASGSAEPPSQRRSRRSQRKCYKVVNGGAEPVLADGPPPAKKKRVGNGKGKWAKKKPVEPTIPEDLLRTPPNLRKALKSTLRASVEPKQGEEGPRVQVRNSGSRGRGLYALQDCDPGDIIYAEAPMFTFPRGASDEEVLDGIMRLSYVHMRALWQLEGSGGYQSLIKGLRDANTIPCVADYDGDGDDDPLGIFEAISRINHSCMPNAGWFWSESAGKLLLIAYNAISAGEELTASYVDSRALFRSRAGRRTAIRDIGFKCRCPLCAAPNDESDRNREKLRTLLPADADVNKMAAESDILVRLHEAARLLRTERLVHPLIDVYLHQFYVLAAWGKEDCAKIVAGFAVAALACTRGREEALKHFIAGLHAKPKSWPSYGFMLEE